MNNFQQFKLLIIIILLVFLSACQPTEADIQEALGKTQTASAILTPINTPTIEPTPTVDYTSKKNELTEIIKTKTNDDVANINCHRVTWEDNLLKLNCVLVDWVIEPSKDHHFLHFRILENAIMPVLLDEDWEKYFDEISIIEIVSAGQVLQELSKTDFMTLKELMDGTITTEIEWLSVAETIIN